MDIHDFLQVNQEGVNVVSWESVQQKMLRRVARYPDGSPVGPWRTYDPPPLYLRDGPQVVDLNKYTR
jgi:hypothetical protein